MRAQIFPAHVPVDFQAGKVIMNVMMKTTIVGVNGMEQTVAVVMLIPNIVQLVNVFNQLEIIMIFLVYIMEVVMIPKW